MRRASIIAAIIMAQACGPKTKMASVAPHPPTAPATSQPVARRAGHAHAVLPPGVLAEAKGRYGALRVEVKAGRRVLTIDGVVQGAAASALAGDPLAALMRTLRPKAKPLLLLGLGTGTTARSFAQAGFDVTAVEREPTVIAWARRYFGFRGKAVAAEAASYVRALGRTQRFDAIVVDTGGGPAEAPLHEEAIMRRMRAHLAPSGLLVVRTLGRPKAVKKLLGRLPRVFTHVYGSGVADEPQNLYVVHSPWLINLVSTRGMPLWLLHYHGHPAVERVSGAAAKTASLLGYLIRLPPTKAGAKPRLALDLPHWEMGAIRYVLRGKPVTELARHLPAKARFVTQGEIRSDGSTKGTLISALGGGGAKRSDVRFSPTAVALEGRVRILAVVEPDSVMGGHSMIRRQDRKHAGWQLDPRLPYGGALYELEVSRVVGVLEAKTWQRFRRRRLATFMRRATRAIRRGRPRAARQPLRDYLEQLDTRFVGFARRLRAYREMSLVERSLAVPKSPDKYRAADPKTFELARVCDRARRKILEPLENPDVAAIAKELDRCAIKAYRRTARGKYVAARLAAERLLWLLGTDPNTTPAQDRRIDAEKARLRKRFAGGKEEIKALSDPP